jgi:hypothetical protein
MRRIHFTMAALIPHLIAGLIAGSIFRVQTLVLMVLAVLAESAVSSFLLGAFAGLLWLLVSQVALQIGYLGGMYIRSLLELVAASKADNPKRTTAAMLKAGAWRLVVKSGNNSGPYSTND